ncbi:hypothetical protein DPMN_027445 [Dreissena polymorpha]|uniref:Uncharacterized protein n=1 Tax=Dreissena polymorpha TaxID=45954 RepID=A0A9D4LSV9_DREPO|nr:hypothetical protein DPMN_027445 [Dreissena polymorpha]
MKTAHHTEVSVHFIRWKILNMLKTSQRTEQMSPDIAKPGADSPDMKRTLNG